MILQLLSAEGLPKVNKPINDTIGQANSKY